MNNLKVQNEEKDFDPEKRKPTRLTTIVPDRLKQKAEELGKETDGRKIADEAPELLKLLVQGGHLQTLETLLEKKPLDLKHVYEEEGNTLCHLAAAMGAGERDAGIIRLLVSKGANPEMPNKNGMLPVHKAAEVNNIKALQFLVEQNRNNLNAKDGRYKTPLDFAAEVCITMGGQESESFDFLVQEKAEFGVSGKELLQDILMQERLQLLGASDQYKQKQTPQEAYDGLLSALKGGYYPNMANQHAAYLLKNLNGIKKHEQLVDNLPGFKDKNLDVQNSIRTAVQIVLDVGVDDVKKLDQANQISRK